MHAPYRCRRQGACCTASWPIPVEADRLAALRAALASGAVRPAAGVPAAAALEMPATAPAETPALVAVRDHRCVFFDRDGTRGCRIQEALGHDALPLACRQFPRVTVRDPGGISVTLSCYCPTAASLLDAPGPMRVTTDAAGFPSDAEYVGLDASHGLPPLLVPQVLMDWDAWWQFEARAVEWIANDAADPVPALAGLHTVVEDLRRWRPGAESLMSHVDRAFDRTTLEFRAGRLNPDGAIEYPNAPGLVREVIDAIPSDLHDAVTAPAGRRLVTGPRAARFLAAHAFANWTAHLGGGLRTWLRSLEAADALLEAGFDVGQADLVLRHLADPGDLAKRWSAADTGNEVGHR